MGEKYPSFEQWKALQGGKPLILANEASTVFQIAHVYPNNREEIPLYDAERAKKIGHYGCLIDTPAVQMNNSVNHPVQLLIGDYHAPVVLPAVLYINRHGAPCAQRSGKSVEPGYRHIGSSTAWNNWLEDKAQKDWDLWKVEQNPEGKLKLIIVSSLRKLLENRTEHSNLIQ